MHSTARSLSPVRYLGAFALPLALLLSACGSGSEPPSAPPAAEPQAASAEQAPAQQPPGPAAEFIEGARSVLGKLQNDADPAALSESADRLMRLGASMVPAYVQRHPHCADYLQATLAIMELWPQLELETIERDYHEDGALPATDNVAVCYHLKDLIVHPATVLALLAQPEVDFAAARREIEETLAHASVVEAALR
jgi:hypothetical protein